MIRTLFFILFLSVLSVTAFSSHGYAELSSSEIKLNPLIQDLQKLGADYVVTQGIFNQQLPNGFWNIEKTESASRRTFSAMTSYKFVVQIKCESQPKLIRAAYEISFVPTTGYTAIKSFSHSLIPNALPEAILADAPAFVDTKLIKKGTELKKLLDKGAEYTVKDAIQKGLIKNTTYTVTRIFWAKNLGFSRIPGNTFSVLLTGHEGYNYRVEITSYDNSEALETVMNPNYKIYKN